MSDQPTAPMNETTAPASTETPQPTSPNAAVQACCAAWQHAFTTEYAKKKDDWTAGKKAAAAFRNAMPYLVGRANIKDFIACVAHGVLLTAISPEESAKLLYAVQVALGSERLEARTATQAKPGKPDPGTNTPPSPPIGG